MQILEVLEALYAGKEVVRRNWEAKDGYLVLLPGMKNAWRIVTEPVNAGNHIFSMEELASHDWELLGWNHQQPAEPVCEPVPVDEQVAA